MKKFIIKLVVASLVIVNIPIANVTAIESEPIVQVKLVNYLGNKTSITVIPTGDYKSLDKTITLHSGLTYTIKQENGMVSLYDGTSLLKKDTHLEVKPIKEGSTLMINDRPYLGGFDFTVESNQYIRPINKVYMEDYLKGVVPIEMYPSWNNEALKSQAVAARTYAMSHINEVINDTISYQAYVGKNWQDSTSNAVDQTLGEVLKYNGNLIDAVFSASNGGVTESNANAWAGSVQVPYLTIKQDTYDPKKTWSISINKKQIDLTGKDLANPDSWWNTTKEVDTTVTTNIKNWLLTNGYQNKELKIVNVPTVSLYAKGSGGRVTKGDFTVEFFVKGLKNTDGKLALQKVSLVGAAASKIRSILGIRLMLSYLVDNVDVSTTSTKISGRGDGHGVGMSQWGAKYRADAGIGYKDILSFYYTGTTLTKVYEKHPIDTTPPVVSSFVTNYDPETKSVNVNYSINENSTVTFQIKDQNGNSVSVLENESEKLTGNNTNVWKTDNLNNGTFTFEMNIMDESGNETTFSKQYVLDNTAPVISGYNVSYDSVQKTFLVKYGTDENINTSLVVKDNAGYIIATKNVSSPSGTNTISVDTTNIPDGTYTFEFTAKDSLGNKTYLTKNYLLDRMAPTVTDYSVSYEDSNKTISINYTIDEDSVVNLIATEKDGTVYTINNAVTNTTGKHTVTWDVSNVPDGSYTFTLKTKDASNNESTSNVSYELFKIKTGTVTATTLNVRSGPSTSYSVIGYLKQNQVVTIIGQEATWYKINFGTGIGYVSSSYITNIK